MLNDIRGLKVLVFGGSSGIGAAAVEEFAGLGADVAIHYASGRDRAAELRDKVAAAGVNAVSVGGDLRETGAATRVVEEAVEALGGLDVLINNAGAMVRRASLEEVEREIYDRIMDLNVWPVIEASQAALPKLRASKNASILNVSSIAARNGGGAGAGVYASAKAFVSNYTRNMAKELAKDGIRVNAIAPGLIQTPFHAETPKDVMDGLAGTIPMGRVGTPADCAGSLVFLASGAMSGYVTGHTIDINGGMLMI